MSKQYSSHKAMKKAFHIIASEFSAFFAKVTQERYGVSPSPQSIQVQSIEIRGQLGRGRQLHLVEVPFSSDCGFHQARLFIKTFREKDKGFQEAQGAQKLAELLADDPYVKTPQMLYFSQEHNILVYEGLYATTFDDWGDLTEDEKFFLTGLSLPRLHGSTIKELDLQRYYLLLERTMDRLGSLLGNCENDYSDQIPELRKKLVDEVEGKLFYAHGGGRSFGDFHSGNIMFEVSQTQLRDTNTRSDWIIVYLLDPEFIETGQGADQIDRFEDVATFFAKRALNEFVEKKSLTQLTKDLRWFLRGYNFIFQELTGLHLHQLYPKGVSLEFHMCMGLLYDMLYFVRLNKDFPGLCERGVGVRLDLINHILDERIPLKPKKEK